MPCPGLFCLVFGVDSLSALLWVTRYSITKHHHSGTGTISGEQRVKLHNKLCHRYSGVLGLFTKQTYTVCFILLGFYLIYEGWRKKNLGKLICYIAGGAITSGIILMVLYTKGILADYWECCFRFNLFYARDYNVSKISEIGRLFEYCRFILPLTIASFILGWPLKKQLHIPIFCWLIFFLWTSWWILQANVIPVSAAFVQLALYLPSLVLIGYYGLTGKERNKKDYLKLFMLLLCVFIFCGRIYTKLENFRCASPHLYRSTPAEITDLIQAQPNSALYTYGTLLGMDLCLKTGRKNPLPYYYTVPFLIKDYLDDNRLDEMIRRIDSSQPCIIVDTKENPILGISESDINFKKPRHIRFLDKLAPYVEEHYFEAKRFDDGTRILFPNQWRDRVEASNPAAVE